MAILVAPTVEPATTGLPPRVKLVVTDTLSSNATVTVTRQDPNGRMVPVRTPSGESLELSAGTGLLYDYEAPFGQPVYYSTLEDPATISGATQVDESRVWLIHPGVPVVSQPITVQQWGERSHRGGASVFYPMGRPSPLVFTDGGRKSAEYQLTVLTQSEGERVGLATLLEDASPLLLNVPAAKGWGVGAEYVSVGDVSESRLTRFAGNPLRSWSLPCTVVRRPAGGSQADRTWADIFANYATWADVKASFASWFDVLAGP